ncbi:MAG: 4-phosphoerythronate dehydrogenase [Bacteroidales bacterium]|nr:4-phosphoerythronate dehydrogenase [Bacteroidales bacterium]
MKIVADDKIPFLKGILEHYAEVKYLAGDQIAKSDIHDADALLTRSITQCNEDLLANTSVKFVASATIGDDHIDKDFCKKSNITWTTAKGCNAVAVEQYFTAGLLALSDKHQIDLSRKIIGIIGVGNIGKRVQKVSGLLGLKVLINDPPRERVEGSEGFSTLKEIQENADVITLHTPLIFGDEDKTFHLVDQTFFNELKKPVIFINTSRGAVVDSFFLKDAINEGKVKHTLIDVWEGEPNVDEELLELVDIATPHIAGYSINGKIMGSTMTIQALSEFFDLGIENCTSKYLKNQKYDTVRIDCDHKSDQQILTEILAKCYDIFKDDSSLRKDPGNFEILRKDYNFRGEFNDYEVILKNASQETIERVKQFGFI